MLLCLWQGRKVVKLAVGSAASTIYSVVWEDMATFAVVSSRDAIIKIQRYK